MTEEWRSIAGYVGFYEVSNLGRVRSLVRSHCKGGNAPRKTPLIMKARDARGDGYFSISLMQRSHYVHVLVATAFHGPRPSDDHECRHKDGDSTNCHESNLEWGTSAQNQQDRVRHGTDVRALKHPRGKLSDAQALEIIRRKRAGELGVALAQEFKVSPQLVSRFVNGQLRKWLHV